MYKIIFVSLLLLPLASYGQFFKCVVEGVTSFQDRPCQYGADGRMELDIAPSVNVVKAPEQHSSAKKTGSPSKERQSNLAKVWKQRLAAQRRCERAKARYKRHLSLMRAGYSHKRSNRMGEKSRRLKAEINERCL